MESAALLRSSICSSGGNPHAWLSRNNHGLAMCSPSLIVGKATTSVRKRGLVVACANTPEATISSNSDSSLDNGLKSSPQKRASRATFPSAFEALLLEVCDETSVAELQLKIGDFEMHLKRNIGATNALIPMAPPVPSEPMELSAPVAA
ncbi:uncharacterized protein LOC141605767 [Silene latifolia]|uniref:uncharacterized protein LOC141605767 n=1 Tax=Silene latifolia TaxID=37657 RepID=UPI003D78A8D5